LSERIGGRVSASGISPGAPSAPATGRAAR
jgi:hypothetical protein